MAKPALRLPPLVSLWLTSVGACFFAVDWLPQYRQILLGLGFLTGGPLMSYLAIALPRGGLRLANADRPLFLQIPEPGRHARSLLFAAGICLTIAGIAELAGLT